MPGTRAIIHVDMDAFFASVEQVARRLRRHRLRARTVTVKTRYGD